MTGAARGIGSAVIRPWTRSRRRLGVLVLGLTAALVAAGPAWPSELSPAGPQANPAANSRSTYTNPVADGVADNFADPSIIRGRDGYWYAYATNGRLTPDDTERHRLPIIRSRDLVNWEYVGDVLDGTNHPDWFGPKTPVWGASIQFFDGKYHLYYVVRNAPGFEQPNAVLAVATAPTPAGPWAAAQSPLYGPKWYVRPPHGRRHQGVIGPEVIQAANGTRYLYYGGFVGGLWVIRLTDDGTDTVGEPVKLVGEAHLEGAYIVRRDGWYYLFASSNHCCLGGPVAGYPSWVARSKSPTGPFVDRKGRPILGMRAGGTPVIAPTGNSWVGTAANSVTTDLAGQDWLVYHAIDRHDPYLGGPNQGGLQRSLLIDRLDWIDGWPTVRGGRGASDGAVPAPMSAARIADAFTSADSIGRTWRNGEGWQLGHEAAGGYVHTGDHAGERVLRARGTLSGDVRVRAAVRLPGDGADGAVGFRLAGHGAGGGIEVTVDRAAHALDVSVRKGAREVGHVREPLPEGFDYGSWHQLAVEIRGNQLQAKVSDAGQHDPVAVAEARLPAGLAAGPMGLLARDAAADVDDVTATELYDPHTSKVPDPEVGDRDPARSDEFDGDALGGHWSWIREPTASIRDGAVEFPVQAGQIIRNNDNAALAVRSLPEGTWTIETKMEMPLGDEPLHGYPTAGMVVYENDDEFVGIFKHGRHVIRDIRMIRETVFGDRVKTGHAMTGPASEITVWLRIRHTVDPATGEHHFRGASSTDGEHWMWGTTYTMPADARVRVGLMAAGASSKDADAVARFDYLRIYTP